MYLQAHSGARLCCSGRCYLFTLLRRAGVLWVLYRAASAHIDTSSLSRRSPCRRARHMNFQHWFCTVLAVLGCLESGLCLTVGSRKLTRTELMLSSIRQQSSRRAILLVLPMRSALSFSSI